jgi:hypothetical protein
MTEERFLTYFKCLKNKLNHIINLLQDRGIAVENEENLLPNFPVQTVPQFEQFELNLIESCEIRDQYVRKLFFLFYNSKILKSLYLYIFL